MTRRLGSISGVKAAAHMKPTLIESVCGSGTNWEELRVVEELETEVTQLEEALHEALRLLGVELEPEQ